MTGPRRGGAVDRPGPLARRLGVDARALAALRIALGSLLLADLAMRARDLTAFYTDAGVLPRAVHAETYPVLASLSVHARVGSPRAQALLFGLSAAFALCVLVGYRTRIAAVGAWVLTASLYARNPYVVNGGDTILLAAFFFCLFCPLSARWSIDARRRRRSLQPTRAEPSSAGPLLRTPATAALLGVVVLVYASNAMLRLRSDRWRAGEAVRLVFELDQYTVLLGPAVANLDPRLFVVANYVWVGLLCSSVFLLALTGRRRAVLVVPYVGVHLTMLATLRTGLFPLAMVALLLAFLPPPCWDQFERRVANPTRGWLRAHRPFSFGRSVRHLSQIVVAVDRSIRTAIEAVTGRIGPIGRAVPITRLAPDTSRRRTLATVVVVVAYVGLVGWQAVVVADADLAVGDLDPGDHGWAMFAPNPPETVGWYVAPAEFESGERVDAFGGGAVCWDRPPDAAESYPTVLWHRYLTDLRSASEAEYAAFGSDLCEAARAAGEAVVSLEIHYVAQSVALDGETGPEADQRYATAC